MAGVSRSHLYALGSYVLVALAFAWPLPGRMATHLPGTPDGDTGIYVWNQWVFHHELVEHRRNPYFTDKIFSLTEPADLSLHNYTALADVMALPLIGRLGSVATFNLIYLLLGVMSAYAMFLLVRTAAPGAVAEAWLAGVLFAWSPMLVARGGAHVSLVAAAPLPLLALLLIRIERHRLVRDAVLLGIVVALAAYCDAYYAVYCVLLAAGYAAVKVLIVERRPPAPTPRRWPTWPGDLLAAALVVLILATLATGGWTFTLFGHFVSARELYTPVLVLTALLAWRLLRRYRVSLAPLDRAEIRGAAWLASCAATATAVLLSPVLYALAWRAADGRFAMAPVYWRSSPPGVDLLALFLPNPTHPLSPDRVWEWLATRPNGAIENVASLPLVALGVLAAAWRTGWRPPRVWTVLGLGFALLALGPFVRIAGANTYVPGPWALLRYVPLVGLARIPTRFVVVAMLAVALLFALALRRLRSAYPARQRSLVWVVGGLLLFELLPAPRTLARADVPRIYQQIAADPRETVRVLHLPFGVRDGTSSAGNFTSRTQFYQTVHGKRLIGGYLSRVSRRRVERIRRYPILDALIRLSEGQTIPPRAIDRLARRAEDFVSRANIAYVVVDRGRASPELADFAVRVLRLDLIASEGDLDLYQPKVRRPLEKRASPLKPRRPTPLNPPRS